MSELVTSNQSIFESGAARLAELKARHNLLVQATKEVLTENLDYGVVPGTGDKPTLLKPGAEKLCFLFGLRPTFKVVGIVEDWDRGLFYYRYLCELHDAQGNVSASSEGSCNSKEKKYRYRQGERKCPKCGKPTIIKGKEEYGGGWICYAKKGGCGAKFYDTDPAIVNQETGQIENTEPFDLVNTLQKMAQKRALVAAVLVGTGASQFFTQDVEDMQVIEGSFQPVQFDPHKVTMATFGNDWEKMIASAVKHLGYETQEAVKKIIKDHFGNTSTVLQAWEYLRDREGESVVSDIDHNVGKEA